MQPLHELHQALVEAVGRAETPCEPAGRTAMRANPLENERDVLGYLLGISRGAFVLWDQELKMVCISPEAKLCLEGGLRRDELQAAAVAALCQIHPFDALPLGESMLGRPRELKSARGSMLAEFSSVRTADGSHWLMADLKSGSGGWAKLATLTAAERRVLRLLTRGLSNAEIGSELFVSGETVKTHVARILSKLDVSSRAKAAKLGRDAAVDRQDFALITVNATAESTT